MPAESPWDSTRWRDANHTPRYETVQQHPQLAASQQHTSGSKDSHPPSWHGSAHGESQYYDYDSRRPSQANNGKLSQYAPPDRTAGGSSHGPPTPSTCSNAAGSHGYPWTTDASFENKVRDGRPSETHLSLQIPNRNPGLPSLAHGYTTPRSDAPIYSSSTSSWSQHTTSLPSFAALSEQTNRNDEPDEVEIAPMSARLSCSQCAKLAPLIREAANGLFELEGNVQNLCRTTSSRSADIPNDSAMRTMQWILSRMRYTNREVQDAMRHGVASQPSTFQHFDHLKRSADPWEQDEMPSMKLPRPNPPPAEAPVGERRASVDFASRDAVQQTAYSPAPSDSAPGSAYPRHGSPIPGRLPRALPSPSSLAFPPSGAASFAPGNAASIGSPETSYHPASSIHTVSTNSATSAHLQDLQHQVSLKSLALQTLQTEYATLLQKLQRERIKSQTIEKKTTVADQEVNDLTTRNEELQEQIKALEGQLQECERKRDAERIEATREKEQWGRMLDMSGRLQSKSTEDRRRLANENADLLQRLAAYETNGSLRPGKSSASVDMDSGHLPPSTGIGADGHPHAISSTPVSLGDVEALRRENTALQARVTALNSSLEEVHRNCSSMEESILHLTSHKDLLRRAIDTARLGGKETSDSVGHNATQAPGSSLLPLQAAPASHSTSNIPSISVTGSPANPTVASATTGLSRQSQSRPPDPFSPENLARIARAVSPGPSELGFHVQPSTSSPEELIRALGPVPAPLPSIRFPSSSSADWEVPVSADARQRRRQSQPFIAPLNLPPGGDGDASFRPLSHAPPTRAVSSGQYQGSSPHSHHSSPGPNLSNTSSPGTTSTRSPEYSSIRADYNFGRRHSQPQLAPPSTTAMPPPPRPFP